MTEASNPVRVFQYAPDRIAVQVRGYAQAALTIAQAAEVVGALADAIAEAKPRIVCEEPGGAKICPACGHVFRGKGWSGVDSHWRANHEDIMSFERIREKGYRL